MADLNIFAQLADNIKANVDNSSRKTASSLEQNSYLNANQTLVNAANQAEAERMQDPMYRALKEIEQADVKRQQDQVVSDSMLDSPLGQAANIGVSIGSGIARSIGQLTTLPASVEAGGLATVPQQYLDAYNIVQQAEKQGITQDSQNQSPEVAQAYKILNTPIQQVGNQGFGEASALQALATETYGNKIRGAIKANKFANKVTDALDISRTINPTNRDQVTEELSDAWDRTSTAWKNDDIGSLAAGASLIGNAIKATATNPLAISEYVAENLPSLVMGSAGAVGKVLMAADNTGYAFGIFNDQVKDYQDANQGKLPDSTTSKKMLGLAATAALAEQVGDTKMLKALLEPKNVVGNVIGTSVKEAATEGYQTAVEEGLYKGNIAGKEMYLGAAIGAASGGAIASAGSVAKGISQGTQAVSDKNKEFAAKRNEVKNAVETGDIAKFTDDTKPDFDINKAVDVLDKRNAKEDVPIAEKQQNAITTDELIQKEKSKLLSIHEKMQEIDITDPKQVAALQKEAKGYSDNIAKLQAKATNVKTNATLSESEINDEVSKAVDGDTESAKRSFGSFKVNPESLNEDQADALANANNGLTESQNQELKAYANIQRSLRDADSVRDNIINGGVDPDTGRQMFGIKDYRDMVFNPSTREAGLKGLKNFADGQEAKVSEKEAALEQVNQGSAPIKVGNFTVHKGSAKQIAKEREEANLLKSTYSDLASIGSEVTSDTDTATDTPEAPVSTSTTSSEQVQADAAEVTTVTPETSTETSTKQDDLNVLEREVSNERSPVIKAALDKGAKALEPKEQTKQEEELQIQTEPVKDTEQGEVETKTTEAIESVKDYSLVKDILNQGNYLGTQFQLGRNPSALDSINNFVLQFKNDPNVLNQFFDKGIPEGALDVANSFVSFHDKLVPSIDKLFTTDVNEKFKHQDYLQFMVDENGQLPSNVKTAIVVGAYNWLISNGNNSMMNSADDIRSMFGLPEDAHVPSELYDLVGNQGASVASVKDSSGKAAVAALNFSSTNDALLSSQSMLNNSFGNMIYAVMLESGMATYSKVSNAEIAKYLPKDIQVETKGFSQFLKPKVNEEGKMADTVKQYIETNKEQSNFMQKVFGTEVKNPMPSFEVPTVDQTIKNSTQQIPEATQDILKKHQERKHYIEQDVFNVFSAIGLDGQRSIMGYDFNPKTKLKVMQSGIDGANRDIDRQIEDLNEFVGSMDNINDPFYFKHNVWVNQRMGIANRVNPQASKLHRFMINQGAWKTTVNLDSANDLRNFYLTVGESLDIVSDKITQDVALDKVQEVLAKPEIRNAVQEIKKVLSGNTDIDVQTIVEGVKVGDAKAHTLAGLTALAKMELAEESNLDSFDYALFRECDGITNGVCFSTLQFPAEDSAEQFRRLNRMGVYESNTNFSEWRKNPANQDSYESLANDWENQIKVDMGKANDQMKAKYEATKLIIGSFSKFNESIGSEAITKDGRNASKLPLMTTIYGAGIKGVVDGFANQYIDNTYKKIQKAIDNKDIPLAKELLKSVNTLTGSNHKKLTLDFKFTGKEINSIKTAVTQIYGNSLDTALQTGYSELMDARKQLNAGVNLAFELYNKMYQQEVDKVLATKESWQKELTRGEQKAINDKLIKAMPIVNTLMSQRTNNLNEGMALTKSEMVPQREGKNNNDNPYYAQTKFAKPVRGTGSKSSSNFGMKRENKAPGVAGLPLMVQSMDATTMLLTLKDHDVLNVHDAIGTSDNGFESATQGINKSFAYVNSKYSIASQVSTMFDRVKDEAVAAGIDLSDIKLPKSLAGERTGVAALEAVSVELRNTANMYDNRKHRDMNKVKYWGQYYDGANTGYVRDAAPVKLDTAVKEDIENMKGSSAETELKDNYQFEAAKVINKYSTQEVYDRLQENSVVQDSANHKEQLQNVLENIVNKVVSPFNLYLGQSTDTETVGATNGQDMYIVNQIYGANSPSGSLANGIRMSAGEVLLHELVHNVTQVGIDKNEFARRELQKLWTQAKKVITVRDFLSDTNMLDTDPQYAIEYAAAKDRYDHIFTPKTDAIVNGKKVSNYLHEFVALGLTNERFREKLASIGSGSIQRLEGNNLLAKLGNWFSNLLDKLNSMIHGTSGTTVGKQLDQLALTLANVDTNSKSRLVRDAQRAMYPVREGIRAVRNIKDTITPAYNRLVKAKVKVTVDAITDTTKDSDAYKNFKDTVKAQRAEIFNSDNAVLEGLVSLATEAKGRTKFNGSLHDLKRMGTHTIDKMRELIRFNTRNVLLESYQGKLSKQEQSAITYGLVKTDTSTLMDNIGLKRTVEVLRNEAAIDEEINLVTTELRKNTDSNFLIKQAHNLGYFMATGQNSLSNGLLNAHNIARLFTTGKTPVGNVQATTKHIDTLASLYAIKYTSDTHKSNLRNVIGREFEHSDTDNGITFTMNLLKDYREQANQEFKATPEHQIKGYIFDKVNPDIDVKIGTLDDQEEMVNRGYALGKKLPKDLSDPRTQDIYMYVNKQGGLNPYLAGASYLMSNKARGSKLIDMTVSPDNLNLEPMTKNDIATLGNRKKLLSTNEYKSETLDKTKVHSAPIVNGKGEAIDYRYMMLENTKDSLLERDTQFADLLGIMSGNLSAKPKIKEQNQNVVIALKDQFDGDYANNSDLYVEISPRSPDAKLREIYAQLPHEMRDIIKGVWGGSHMLVRKDVLDLMFGYRKMSLADPFRMSHEERSTVAKVLVPLMEKLFGKKIANRIRYAENIIQELVKGAKDIIVVKSAVVTIGNTVSNVMMLLAQGIGSKDIIKNYTVAFKAANRYKRQAKRLEEVKSKLQFGTLNTKQREVLQIEQVRLEDDIANNPIISLIDEGVLQNIVEDVNVGTEDYSLRKSVLDKASQSKLAKRIGSHTPKVLKTIASEALILQGSNMYSILSEAAQFSDFGARYVRFKNLTERTKNPLDVKTAVGKIMDEFIDYDIPTHKALQYMNDIGVVMFSKYLIRVQKVIAQMFLENPARVLGLALMQNLFGNVSDITDSIAFLNTSPLSRITNPISMITGAADEMLTAQLL